MRLIVACVTCDRQYDASGQPAGRRFRCSCGEIVVIKAVRDHSAAVVRCSACGAPRGGAGAACGHCGADFTLHERDLQTICPGCLTRISDGARYCHSCGLGIGVLASVGDKTQLSCPTCADQSTLSRRGLGEGLTIHECGRCAGMWLDSAAFEHVVAKAEQLSATIHGPVTGERRSEMVEGSSPQGPVYRPCVRCGKLMNRQNYGKRSNVVIDVCKDHGAWFDAHELGRILDWVRGGGLEQMRAHERDQLRNERRRLSQASTSLPFSRTGEAQDDRGADLFEALLRLFR